MRVISIFALCSLSAALVSSASFADTYFIPREKRDLFLNPDSVVIDSQMVHVRGAKVAYINTYALTRDFPFLQGLSPAALSKWILANCAYVSRDQQELNEIRQTAIPVDGATTVAFRQDRWGRAADIPVNNLNGQPAGFVDVKGCGLDRQFSGKAIDAQKTIYSNAHADPAALEVLRKSDTNDGAASFREAIAEVIRSEALQRSFNEVNHLRKTHFEVIESYFIIVLPYNLLRPHGRTETAALIGRQAHLGRHIATRADTNDIYLNVGATKQFDATDTVADMGLVVPVYGAFRDRFLLHEHGFARHHPEKTRDWVEGERVAREYVAGDDDAVTKFMATFFPEAPVHPSPHPRLPTAREMMEERNASEASLRHMLTAESSGVRELAVRRLRSLHSTDIATLEAFARALRDPDYLVSSDAIDALAEVPKLPLSIVIDIENTLKARASTAAQKIISVLVRQIAMGPFAETERPVVNSLLNTLVTYIWDEHDITRKVATDTLIAINAVHPLPESVFHRVLDELKADGELAHFGISAYRLIAKTQPRYPFVIAALHALKAQYPYARQINVTLSELQ